MWAWGIFGWDTWHCIFTQGLHLRESLLIRGRGGREKELARGRESNCTIQFSSYLVEVHHYYIWLYTALECGWALLSVGVLKPAWTSALPIQQPPTLHLPALVWLLSAAVSVIALGGSVHRVIMMYTVTVDAWKPIQQKSFSCTTYS